MALTKTPIELSSTPSIVDGGNATAITIDSSEDVTLAGELKFADDKKAIFGAGSDLEIYHTATGNHSIIEETGGGNLVVRTNGAHIEFDKGSTEYMARMIPDGAVELYYDSALKLATASGGVTITGNTQSTSLTVGTSNDAGEALNILDGGHTGQGAANTVSLASFAENVSGNASGVWFGSMTNENTAIIGTRTASGNLGFQTYNGSAWNETLRLDNLGRVTNPYQPAFLVTPSSSQSNIAASTNVTIAFGTEIFDVGSNFASNTFTAPVTGKYQLNVNLRLNNVDAASAYYHINLTTSNRTYYSIFDPDFGQDAAYYTIQLSVLADMDANDTASVILFQSAGTAQTDIQSSVWSTFSGYLVA